MPSELLDLFLDAAGVRQAIGTVAKRASYLDVAVQPQKGAARRRAALGEATEALLAGRAEAVQLRYRARDGAWSDTVTRAGNRYRLLRVSRGPGSGVVGTE